VEIRTLIKDQHTKHTLHLAWPLILTQVGHVVTGMVDNIFLGGLGPAEQAAGILSNNLYMLVIVFCIGVSYATTPLVTGAHERQDVLKKASLLKNSLFLNVCVAVACFVLLYFGSGLLVYMHQPEEVVVMAIPFFDVMVLSMIPVSFFFTCKQFCEGLSNTRVALVISILGNLINIIMNYLLIYGKLGLPELGYMGAAWASFIARVFMGVSFIILIFRSRLTSDIASAFKNVRVNWTELRDLARIGFNTGLQFTVEVAAFVIAGFMAGTFGKEQIDAHGIALSLASLTYMFGSGLGSAATIRAGIFKAQNNWLEIRNAARAAIKLVLWLMGSCGVLFLIFNNYLPMAFSGEPQIILLAAKLLIIAAMFQLFDGMQVTILGVLRGLADVKIPTIIAVVGYWLIAIPLAYFLAFVLNMETIGIWIGLLVALVVVSAGLLWRLRYLFAKHGAVN